MNAQVRSQGKKLVTPREKEYSNKKYAKTARARVGRLGWGRTGKEVRQGNKTKQTQQTQTNDAQTNTNQRRTKHADTEEHRPEGLDRRDRAARWAKAAAAVQYPIRHESRHARLLTSGFQLGRFRLPHPSLSATSPPVGHYQAALLPLFWQSGVCRRLPTGVRVVR